MKTKLTICKICENKDYCDECKSGKGKIVYICERCQQI